MGLLGIILQYKLKMKLLEIGKLVEVHFIQQMGLVKDMAYLVLLAA